MRSANFYRQVFGWKVRKRGDGSTAFDDTTGEVRGTWVLGRAPAAEPGLLSYIMAETIGAVVSNGGEIVQAIGADAPGISAGFPRPVRQCDRFLPATYVTEHEEPPTSRSRSMEKNCSAPDKKTPQMNSEGIALSPDGSVNACRFPQ